jgi:hypothetical protein
MPQRLSPATVKKSDIVFLPRESVRFSQMAGLLVVIDRVEELGCSVYLDTPPHAHPRFGQPGHLALRIHYEAKWDEMRATGGSVAAYIQAGGTDADDAVDIQETH